MGVFVGKNGKFNFLVMKGEKGDPAELSQVTGRSKEAVMSQAAVTDAFDKLGLYYQSYELIRGTIYDGKPTLDVNMESYRFVTPELVEVRAGAKLEWERNSTYKYGYAFYNKDKVYDGVDRGWQWESGVTFEENGYIYLNFGRRDEGVMTEEDAETLKKICRVVDNSIEKRIDEEAAAVNKKFDMFGLYHRAYDIVVGNLQNGVISTWAGMSPTRAVTPEKIEVRAGVKIRFEPTGTYKFGYAVYDKDGVFNGVDNGWQFKSVTLAHDGYIAMNFGRIDEKEMTEEDFETIKERIRVIDDSTLDLAKKNKLADVQSSIIVEYGRKSGASYVFVRIPKTTNSGATVKPRVAVTATGNTLLEKLGGAKVSPLVFAERENTAFLVNAGLFNVTTMYPVGQLIVDGETWANEPMESDNGVPISATECYPLCIDADGNLSAPYSRDVSSYTMIADGVRNAVVGWGKLVEDFEICADDIAAEIVHPGKYIQQSIGQFENGDYCVCTVEQSRGSVHNEAGLTYTELAEILVEKGVKFAYSLDGGGSAATVIGKRQLNRIYEGTKGRTVPTVIYFDAE